MLVFALSAHAGHLKASGVSAGGSITRDLQLREFGMVFHPGADGYLGANLLYFPLPSQSLLSTDYGKHEGYVLRQNFAGYFAEELGKSAGSDAENGKTTQSYSYDISGQLATADYGDSKETFLWDGLALLSRNNLKYVNEPAVTGGNPILAGDKMLFDDMLGNTLGVKDGEKFSAIDRDAFGELKPGEKPNLAVNFFTGKPRCVNHWDSSS